MKILHCCLAAFYIDNYGYQENFLPKMHKLQGHDVMILASTETFKDNMNLGYLKPSSYITENNIPITRIPYVWWLPHLIAKKLRYYPDVYKLIETFKPDIIFLHDVQFLSINEVAKYAKANKNVVIYADGHTDFNVSARNWLSKNILHKIIYRYCAKLIEPYLRKFYGVLPIRVEFIKNVYKISPEKLDLLVMGGDLTNIDFSKKNEVRSFIRKENNIEENDFLIITGGKIDNLKNVHLLMKSVNEIANKKIKLIVFGSIDNELKSQIEELSKSEFIRYVGWKSSEEVSNYFLASDLAFFPGRHSVLWEQSAALGLPGVFKKWDGIQHLDVGGNVLFLDDVNIESIKIMIITIYNDKSLFEKMKKVAIEKGISYFSYYEIAKRAIEQ